MDEPQVYESKKPMVTKIIQISLISLAVILVLAGLMGAYMYRDQLALPSWLIQTTEVVDENNDFKTDLEGDLYFTLMENGESHTSTYTKDTAYSNSELMKRGFSGTQLSFSPNGEWVVFLGPNQNLTPEEQKIMDDSVAVQVFRARVNDNQSLDEVMSQAEQLTDLEASWKSIPVINDNGEVLFVSRDTGTKRSETELSPIPSDWTIHQIDTTGLVTEITSGIYPHWYQRSGFFYLSDQGIKFKALDEDYEALVLYDEGFETHLIDLFFDVSDDENKLVIATPVGESIEIYNITRSDDSGYELISLDPVISLSGQNAAWPQFSPNGDYVGVMTFNPFDYVIYDASTLESTQTAYNLNAFSTQDLFVTDWR